MPEHIIRFQLGQPLDFDPLTRYAYSNFGYSILGRVIEKVTGQPYEQYVRESILKPLGIERPRIGGSLESERVEGEVKYYDVHNGKGLATVGPGAGKDEVPISYGVWRQETLDAHGGWIASVIDLVNFGAAFDMVDDGRKTRGGLLKAATARLLFSPQVTITKPEPGGSTGVYYGLGWQLKNEDEPAGRPPRRCAPLHSRLAHALPRWDEPRRADQPGPIARRQVPRPLARRAADKAGAAR